MKIITEGTVDAIAFEFLIATAVDKSAAIFNTLLGLMINFYRNFLLFLIHL